MDKPYMKKGDEHKVDPASAKAYIEGIRDFLSTFKTAPCELDYEHDPSCCPGHHNHDQRRNPFSKHSFSYFTDVATVR